MAANHFDQASRFAVKLDAPAFFRWALGADVFTFREWLDTRAVPFPGDPDRTGDSVARLVDPAEHGRPWAVATEFQVEPDALMFGRLMQYLGGVWVGVKPDPEPGSRYFLGAVVVNLTGTGTATRDMQWPALGLGTQLRVVERNLERESATELLGAIETGAPRALLPWIPLMTGGGDAVIIERWKAIAATEPDDRRKSEYGGLALVFADAAGRKPVWKEALKGWNMKRSSVVEEWQAEARVEARALAQTEERIATIVETLGTRFGTLPSDLIDHLKSATNLDDLSAWRRLALTVDSVADFRAQTGL